MGKVIRDIDVIAQFNHDGKIIPKRFQLMNEDGLKEAHTIKGYRPVPPKGAYTTVDGLFICNSTKLFECQVILHGMPKVVRLYFEPIGNTWFLGID